MTESVPRQARRHSTSTRRPTKVLYIAGSHRSGSTLLGNCFGEMDGFWSGGEMSQIWLQLLTRGQCGCGSVLEDCHFWRPIIAEAEIDRDPEALSDMNRAVDAEFPTRSLRILWRPQWRLRRWASSRRMRIRGKQ